VVVAAVDEDERNEVVIRVAAVMVVDKASADDDLDFRIRCFLALLDLPMFVDARSWKDEGTMTISVKGERRTMEGSGDGCLSRTRCTSSVVGPAG
jgi:hypothetical protein